MNGGLLKDKLRLPKISLVCLKVEMNLAVHIPPFSLSFLHG